MKQTLSVNLKMSQNLVMTPQLQQSIKILQLSRIELIETIKEELETNPILEEEAFDTQENFSENFDDALGDNNRDKSLDNAIEDMDWSSYFENLAYASFNKFKTSSEEDTPDFENFTSKKQTLEEYLLWQLRLTDISENDYKIAEYIIYNLNKDGYLDISLEDIAKEFNVDIQKVNEIRKRINFLDPVGIAAIDLKECILIQMEFYGCKNSLAKKILENHLNLVENKNIKTLAKIFDVSEEKVIDAIKEINSFEPRPARLFGNPDNVQTIIPDVYVVKKDDEFVILLNDDGIPKFRINEEYVNKLIEEGKEDVKKFLQEKVNNAKWLLKSIDQRERTIYKVVQSIIKFQRDFFEKGPSYLKPLILKDIAEDLNLHESTISRTTNNKYISTPHGIYELKYFFNTSIGSTDGSDDFSTRVVMEKIREIVDSEPPNKPFSDEKISEILEKKFNIKLARRTVAKYRTQMNILPSSKRKKIL